MTTTTYSPSSQSTLQAGKKSTAIASSQFVELPAAPINGSPVPELTSIHAVKSRGPYGSNRYRGNCGGYLIRNLLRYFQPTRVLDPMSGSGTCGDVCRELGIEHQTMDIRRGQDAGDPQSYEHIEPMDFVWMHPPYWRMIRYNEDPRCLSNALTLDDFLDRMQMVLRNTRRVLHPKGKIGSSTNEVRGEFERYPMSSNFARWSA